MIKVVNLICHIPQASSKTNKCVRKHQINLGLFYSWTPWSINRAHISKVRNDVSLLEDTPYPINQTRPFRRHLAAGFWDQLKMEWKFSIFCYCEGADKVLHSREIWSKSFKCWGLFCCPHVRFDVLYFCLFFSLLSLLLLCYFNMFEIKPQKGTGYVSTLLTQSMQLNIIFQKLLSVCVLIWKLEGLHLFVSSVWRFWHEIFSF